MAVDRLSFEVRAGEIFGLLGPNGAGKTTMVNLITGMLRRDGGEVRVLDWDPQTEAHRVRQCIGYVPQETNVYPDLSAVDNLWHHAALYCKDLSTTEERMEELLKLMNLWERRKDAVRTFSGGMKRRLALARALLHDPEVILFDEPTLGVDVQGRHALWEHIKAQQSQGKTFIVCTNNMTEADALCDRLVIIDHGRRITLDTPEQLKADLGRDIVTLRTTPAIEDARGSLRWAGDAGRHPSRAGPAAPGGSGRRVDRGRPGVAHHGRPPPGIGAHRPAHTGRRIPAPHRPRVEGISHASFCLLLRQRVQALSHRGPHPPGGHPAADAHVRAHVGHPGLPHL